MREVIGSDLELTSEDYECFLTMSCSNRKALATLRGAGSTGLDMAPVSDRENRTKGQTEDSFLWTLKRHGLRPPSKQEFDDRSACRLSRV